MRDNETRLIQLEYFGALATIRPLIEPSPDRDGFAAARSTIIQSGAHHHAKARHIAIPIIRLDALAIQGNGGYRISHGPDATTELLGMEYKFPAKTKAVIA